MHGAAVALLPKRTADCSPIVIDRTRDGTNDGLRVVPNSRIGPRIGRSMLYSNEYINKKYPELQSAVSTSVR